MSYQNTNIYYLEYITIKTIRDYQSIYSASYLYFIIGEAD